MKQHSTIGCCGIRCGLCPRFYTAGASRCPGCGGEGFAEKHPPCGVKTCCAEQHGLELCGQCAEYPCKKYENREKIERDSFVTHKRMFQNHDLAKTQGFDCLLAEQEVRIALLQDMLAHCDDGRSKSFFCLVAALLQPEHLQSAIAEVKTGADMKESAAGSIAAICRAGRR